MILFRITKPPASSILNFSGHWHFDPDWLHSHGRCRFDIGTALPWTERMASESPTLANHNVLRVTRQSTAVLPLVWGGHRSGGHRLGVGPSSDYGGRGAQGNIVLGMLACTCAARMQLPSVSSEHALSTCVAGASVWGGSMAAAPLAGQATSPGFDRRSGHQMVRRRPGHSRLR